MSLAWSLLDASAAGIQAQSAPMKSDPVTSSARPEPVTMTTPTGVVHGTLLVPATPAPPLPIVLLIAGSGPTDRDGNSPLLPGANNSLKLLAEGLAAKGIASLRYDKRGIAASRAAGPSESDLRFDTYVDDAVAWIRQVRTDRRFSTVTAVGHSEGSLIGMVAADRAKASGFVSIAGAGRAAQDILREQLGRQLPAPMMASAERAIAALAAGHLADSTPPELASLFRPSVQPYLISWFRYDPGVEVARLRIPMLIVQGTTDIQVSVDDAKRLAAAAPAATLLLIDGMNHVLKSVPADLAAQRRSYGDPALPVMPQLVDAIAELVRRTR
jgi:pimeloyl-ACP methyl ester carboxylesterase